MSIVTQEAELFSDTIRAKIAYGALGEDVTTDSIKEAYRRAKACEFIDKFENGLYSNIGEGMCPVRIDEMIDKGWGIPRQTFQNI